jgi:RNA polymerase sigma factor (TIGR02999 family)
MSDASEIEHLLRAHAAGDEAALDRVLPLVYEELRRLARRQLQRGPAGRTLETNALVHEAYLKLAARSGLRLNDAGHLLAVTASAMRQILVDRARARLRTKRGGGAQPVTLDEERLPEAPNAERLLDLDRALGRLRQREPRLARAFECRYFAGLSEQETADALGISLRSSQREWLRARTWLRADLEGRA